MNAPRKIWTEEEDQTITDIILNRKIKKWSMVARIMEQQYDIPGRTGKQCRERWHNQLDPNIKSDKWTDREQQLLYRYHNQYGNKWAKIAVYLTGRTDNCVKNHFYSNLRKALRRINLFIVHKHVVGEFRQIRPGVLPKIISAAQEKFIARKGDSPIPQELIVRCVHVKNMLAQYCNKLELEPHEAEELARLINQITELGHIFKNSKTLNDAKLKEHQVAQIPLTIKVPTLARLFLLPNLKDIQKTDNVVTQAPSPIACNDITREICHSDQDSIDHPIAIDPKALMGMEIDSPTMPMLRLRKKRSSRITIQQSVTPCRSEANFGDTEEINPHDAVIRLLNHEQGCPQVDDSTFA